MYATDPTSVHHLRAADLIAAEQSRTARSPVSHRPSWIRRTFLDRIPTGRAPTPETTTPTLASYGSHELLVGLDRRSLNRLAELFMVLDVAPGTSLGRQGEAAPEFVIVLEGRIGVSIDGVPFVVFDEGSHFGALPLLDDGPTPYQRASFDVLEPTRIAVAGRLDFAELLESQPLVARRIRAIADVRRAYLRGRADASPAITSTDVFPLHMADLR